MAQMTTHVLQHLFHQPHHREQKLGTDSYPSGTLFLSHNEKNATRTFLRRCGKIRNKENRGNIDDFTAFFVPLPT